MRLNQWIVSVTVGLLLSHSLFAASPLKYEQVQVPQCLATKIAFPYQLLAENKQFKIIELASSELSKLAILADEVHCGRFVNVSHKIKGIVLAQKHDVAQHILQQPARSFLKPKPMYGITHQEQVNAALNEIVADNIWHTVTQLTAFHNRSATSDSGVATAHWLKAQFETMAVASGRMDTATFFVATGEYQQPSLVTVIGKDIKAPAVVLGAHMDTLDDYMPGADDDGSGSASVMEAARVLLASKAKLKHPVYIIWYAAEERGLVGSQYVVQHFLAQSIPVKAVIQFDMTGYRFNPADPAMWLFMDYTSLDLSHYIARLIQTYLHVPVHFSECGYGCSDHASWTEAGIPAAFPCETSFDQHNPYIHTASDTMALLNLEHMTNFSKLALAFALELALE